MLKSSRNTNRSGGVSSDRKERNLFLKGVCPRNKWFDPPGSSGTGSRGFSVRKVLIETEVRDHLR